MAVTQIGGEIILTSGQGLRTNPSVAGLTNGNIAVVWVDETQPFPGAQGLFDIKGKVLDGSGQTVIAEATLNTVTNGTQNQPDVAAIANGGYLATWTHSGRVNVDYEPDVHFRYFDSAGSSLGRGDTQVNTTDGGQDQSSPATATLANGLTVVVYMDYSNSTDRPDIRAKIENTVTHLPVGNDFLVNTTTADNQEGADVVALAGGTRFVVAWWDFSGEDTALVGRIFNADGSPVTGEFKIHEGGDNFPPRLAALPDGGFVAAWTDYRGDTPDIRARVFDGNGVPKGADFIVNTTTAGQQDMGGIAALSDGRFFVVWDDSSGGTPQAVDQNVRGRVMSQDGTGENDFIINTSLTGAQNQAEITAVGVGTNRFMVTWRDVDPNPQNFGQVSGIEGQILEVSAVTVPGQIFPTADVVATTRSPRQGNVLSNGTGGTGTLTVSKVAAGAGALQNVGGTGTTTLQGQYGSLTIAADGSYTYTPNGDLAVGTTYPETFRYEVSDGTRTAETTLTINVSPAGGGTGNDILIGSGTLDGAAGNDLLVGLTTDDILNGGVGDDVLDGAGGADALNGGDGGDIASYFYATSGVTVNLSLTGPQNTGGSGMDTLTGVEIVVGSNFNDVLTGDAFLNYLVGADGNDVLNGGGSGDVLVGGAGSDFFVIGAAAHSTPLAPDIIADFQSGTDKIDFRAVRTGPADTVSIQSVGPYTMVTLDQGGNGTPDVRVLLAGNAAAVLSDVLLANPASAEAESLADMTGAYMF